MPQQDFTGNAKKAALVGTLAASAGPGTVFAVGTGGGSGHPTGSLGLPWVETIDRGLPTEEKILCSLRNGDNFTISQRGYDSTAVVDHQNGGPVEHTIDGVLLKTTSAHIFDTTRDDHTQYLRTNGTRVATQLGIGRAVGFGVLDVLGAARIGGAAHDVLAVDDLTSQVSGFLTVRQRLAVTAGGLDVAGSSSGYSDELRFTGTSGAGTHAISTNDTGAVQMMFDHRGAGNAGTWLWRNGTNATTNAMTLNSLGVLGFTLSPGTTHESQRVAGQAQIFASRGFGVSGDGQAFQGAVTQGISVAINRADPALSVANAGGPIMQGWSGATKRLELSTAGSLTVFGEYKASAVGGTVRLYLKATDAAVDNKTYDLIPTGNALSLRSLNDAESAASTLATFFPGSAASETHMSVLANGVGLSRIKFGTALGALTAGVPAGGRILYI